MLIRDVIQFLEEKFPRHYAEDFDNTGLLTGDPDWELKGILITHDATETVVDEAIRKGRNLIISFHPIIFSGLKKITNRSYVERSIIKAIKNDIAIYSPHTAVDNQAQGVSYWTLKQLGLKNIQVLMPKQNTFAQLVTYVPHEQAEQVRSALFAAGAGRIGNYDECSYNLEGYGTFRPNEEANPFVGEKNKRHTEPETRISVVFPVHLKQAVVSAMYEAHPYEEPAFEVFLLDNPHPEIGIGSIGEFENPLEEKGFLKLLKEKLEVPFLRHSTFTGKKIKKVALVGGSGAFAIDEAKRAGVDAFVSGDIKYHDFFKAENNILIVDAGHFETERFVSDFLTGILSQKFSNFAITKSETKTNPVNYF